MNYNTTILNQYNKLFNLLYYETGKLPYNLNLYTNYFLNTDKETRDTLKIINKINRNYNLSFARNWLWLGAFRAHDSYFIPVDNNKQLLEEAAKLKFTSTGLFAYAIDGNKAFVKIDESYYNGNGSNAK